MSSTAIILIIGAILVFVIILIVIGLVVYYFLRPSSSDQCGTAINGSSCSANDDCQSCTCDDTFCQNSSVSSGEVGWYCSANSQCADGLVCQNGKCAKASGTGQPLGTTCSMNSQCQSGFCSTASGGTQGYCQNSGTPTGTQDSDCKFKAPCNSGLICSTSGICIVGTPAKAANGTQCTNDSDCASGSCSPFLGTGSPSYCQNPGVTSGYFQAACTSDSDCGTGLNCQNQTCILDNSVPAIGQPCDGSCQLDASCGVIPNGTNVKAYCQALLPSSNNLIPAQLGYCAGGLSYDASSDACLANSQQSCTLNSQCLSGNCQSQWGVWTMGLNGNSIISTNWQNLIANTPGPVEKVVAYTLSGVDWLRILVSGSNAGIYDYQTGTTGAWIQRSSLNSVCNSINGFNSNSQISNFAVSRDGTLHLIVISKMQGNATVPYSAGSSTVPTNYSNVNYAGVFQVDIGTDGMFTNCRVFFDPYPSGYSASPGMILGTWFGTSTETSLPYSGFDVDDPDTPLLGGPLEAIIDIDLDQNFAPLIMGAQAYNPSQSTNVATYYYYPVANSQGQIYSNARIPYAMPSVGRMPISNYYIAPNGPNTAGCQNWQYGVANTATDEGFCFQQSNKLLRTVNTGPSQNCKPQFQCAGCSPSTFTCSIWSENLSQCWLQNADTYYNVPALFASIYNLVGSTGYLAWGQCLALAGVNAGSKVVDAFNYPNGDKSTNPGQLIWDFDVNFAPSINASATYANVVMLMTNPNDGSVSLVYSSSALGDVTNVDYTRLPGYVTSAGRVALGQQGIYYFANGICS